MRASAATPAPQPLLIVSAGHTCVAWWHAPASDAVLPLATVLASSWGEDDIAGYDGLRALAIALAEAGLAALRFEWPDTGDSSAATGAASMADMLAAFDAAATQALALAGGPRLAFVGLGLGALLAAQAASARDDDVVALVGLVPVASGQAFTRTQRELAAGMPAPTPAPRPGTSFDPAELPVSFGGFTQSVRGLEALAALRWPSTCPPSLREALLVAAPEAAVQALVRAGVRVSEQARGEPADAPVALAGVVRWLQACAEAVDARAASSTGATHRIDASFEQAEAGVATARLEAATATVLAQAAAGARTWLHLRANGVAVRERVVRIGDARDGEPPLLVGVLGERDPPAPGLAAPAPRRGIVLLSARGVRRVGPHRLWVSWARQRAARGDVVLRLDLAGVGDGASHPQPDPERRPAPWDARGSGDIARALAWLRREHGVDRIALVGLQSGAWQAWRAALAGHDVQQVVAIDPASLRGPPAAADGGAGLRALARALAARARRALPWAADGELACGLARLRDRGVALDFVFSRGDAGLAPLRAQARRARDGGVNVHEIAQADPAFAGTASRATLYTRLDGLLCPSASS